MTTVNRLLKIKSLVYKRIDYYKCSKIREQQQQQQQTGLISKLD